MGLSHSPSIITDGLEFYIDPSNTRSYPGFGNTIYNIVNSSIGGTLVGYTSNPMDSTQTRSFNFDGVNDFIDIVNSSSWNFSSISICIWFKKNQGSVFKGVVDKGRDNYGAWSLCIDETANRVTFKVRIGGVNRSVTTSSNYTFNGWTFIAGVFDGSNLSIYQNESISSTATYFGSIGTNSYNIRIGADNDGNCVAGLISSVFIYSKGLSSAEIQQLYHATKKKYLTEENIVTNGLVLNIDSNKSSSYAGSGNTIYDLSGFGNTGTLTNGPTFSALNGGSLTFNGTTQYIDLVPSGTGITLTSSSDYNISFWVYVDSSQPKIAPSIIEKYNGVGGYPIAIRYGSNNIYTIVYDGSNSSATGASIIFETWTYFSANNILSQKKLEAYMNASLMNSTTYATLNNITTTSSIKVGYRGFDSNTYFAGKVAHLKIYNRALSATEIQQNYNATKGRFLNALPPVRNGLVLELDALSYSGFGNTWNDSSGNGFNSTLAGSPVFSGIGSTANFLFDANTKSGTLNTNLLSNYSSGTIECSVYITNLTSSFILARQRNGFNTYNLLSIGSYADGGGTLTTGTSGVVYYHNKNGQTNLSSNGALSANTWYRLSITFTTSSIILYINGIQNATVAGDYSVPNDTSVDPRIGAWIKDGTNYPMNGRLAHFTIHNRALSAYEIKQNFDYYRTRYGI